MEKENFKEQIGYSESEKRTPFAGYILLALMVISSLWFGWRTLDDVANIPQRPETLSDCVAPFIASDRWDDLYRGQWQSPPAYERQPLEFPEKPFSTPQKPKCVFSNYEKKYGIEELFSKRISLVGERSKLIESSLGTFKLQLEEAEKKLQELENQYNTALGEKIAKEPFLSPIEPLREQLVEAQNERNRIREQMMALNSELNAIEKERTPLDEQIKTAATDMMDEYRADFHWYEFFVFLLQAFFAFPFFAIVYWLYLKLAKKESPYTIIFSALIFVAGFLVLRVLLAWFWTLFLARVIQSIWNFIQNFALLKSLVFYGGMILSIAIFGGAVWYLQKKIFDPRRLAARRLKNKQCPNCQSSLDIAEIHCPFCGTTIKETCPHCGKLKFSVLKFCPHCGK